MKLKLVCGNCGTMKFFEAEEAGKAFEDAYREGWDTIERFGYNACPRCPGVSVYLPMFYAQEARKQEQPAAREAFLVMAATYTIGPPEGGEWPVFDPPEAPPPSPGSTTERRS